jgi:predicted RNase H-like HicB family nuclease
MERQELVVTALWDDEAGIWVAESEDVPGLATGAATVEQLLSKLEVMIPELLELNSVLPKGELPISLKAERTLRYAF